MKAKNNLATELIPILYLDYIPSLRSRPKTSPAGVAADLALMRRIDELHRQSAAGM